MDLSGYTLLPALADAHVHLFMSGTADQKRRKQQLNEGFKQARGTISRHLGQLVSHGILAVRDGGDRNGYTQRYKKYFVEEKYASICLRVAGKAWHKPGRYGSFVGRSLGRGRLAEGIFRESDDIDHVKIIQSGLNSLRYFGKESPPQFQLKALREAVEVSSSLGAQDHGACQWETSGAKSPWKRDAVPLSTDSLWENRTWPLWLRCRFFGFPRPVP